MKDMIRMAARAKTPPQMNMLLGSVQPEAMATVLTVLWPAGVMLQTPAPKPMRQTMAGTLDRKSTRLNSSH